MAFEITQTRSIEDFEACANLMYNSDPWITLGMNFNDCIVAFEGNHRQIFVLKEKSKNQIEGFIIIQPQGTFKGYIQTICVSESCRGKGYGTLLLQFAENNILTYSPNVFICVSSFNQKALALYIKLGFELVGELPNFVKAGFTELLLRKSKGPIAGYIN
ncbi:MAG: hypothetical protein RIR55_27 [Bacteroidota bacterium]|jgi:ribosomal protein S18 acetylase RimI-like enzyme